MTQIVLSSKVVFLVFAALASIMNPPANVPIFLASTAGSRRRCRKALSWRIALNVFLILVVSMFVGSYILDFFGLSLPIVQVGGGLLIMSFGWTFLHQRGGGRGGAERHDVATRGAGDARVLPADLPAHGRTRIDVDRYRARRQHVPDRALPGRQIVAMITGVALVALSIYLCYRFAEPIARVLGRTGTSVVLRLSAFIALCIGVQIIWNGLTALIRGHAEAIGDRSTRAGAGVRSPASSEL